MHRGRPPRQIDPSAGPLASFAHTLRARRLALGISMGTVAELAGCSPSILGEYERAERAPRDEMFVRDLASALTLDAADLVTAWRLTATQATATTATASLPQPDDHRKPRRLHLRAITGVVLAVVAGLVVLVGGAIGSDRDGADAGRSSTPSSNSASNSASDSVPGSGSEAVQPHATPTVELTPITPLDDQQAVQVAGRGFGPSQGVQIFQCSNRPIPGATPPESMCDLASMVVVVTDPDGVFGPVSFVIDRAITATNYNNEEVDCRVAPECTIVASGGPGLITWADLKFG